MTRKALGRGLRALIPEPPAVENHESAEQTVASPAVELSREAVLTRPAPQPPEGESPRELLRYVPMDAITPNPMQPRSDWEVNALKELARSIEAKGLLEPIILRPSGSGYQIVAGERRWRACKLVGWSEIPAIIRNFEDQESLEVALVENIQRADLNVVDEARAYRVLAMEYALTHDQVAQRVGKDRSTVTNLLRILKLSDQILSHVSRGTLTLGHARVLLGIPDEQRAELVDRIVKESWSVRDTEAWAAQMNKGKAGARRRATRGAPKPEPIRRLEEELCKHFSAEVRIKMSRKGGKLEFRYHDDEDLSRLLDLLGVIIA